MADFFETRFRAARGAVQVSRDDTPVAIRMRYVGAGAPTSVTIITATSLATVSAEASGTVTKTYLFATYTTVGKLVAAINTDGYFQAVALDSLLADVTTSSNFVTGAITAGTDNNGVVSWDVLVDTSVNKNITTNLSLHRDWDVLGKGHRVHVQEIVYNVDVSAAAANAVRLYQRTPSGVETQILGIKSVDVTATTINWAGGQGKITSVDNGDLIVRVQDGTSVTDSTSNFVQVTGLLE